MPLPKIVHRCMDSGMSDFLAKPTDPERLYATLLSWLRATEPKSLNGQFTWSERYSVGVEILIGSIAICSPCALKRHASIHPAPASCQTFGSDAAICRSTL